MDLYRYFHPHHNPRLRSTPLRLQEIAELQQAAIELTRALKRAQIRMSRVNEEATADNDRPTEKENSTISANCLAGAIEAADSLVSELIEFTHMCPDDDLQTMKALLSERKDAPGWETWTQLLKQRLLLEELDGVN